MNPIMYARICISVLQVFSAFVVWLCLMSYRAMCAAARMAGRLIVWIVRNTVGRLITYNPSARVAPKVGPIAGSSASSPVSRPTPNCAR